VGVIVDANTDGDGDDNNNDDAVVVGRVPAEAANPAASTVLDEGVTVLDAGTGVTAKTVLGGDTGVTVRTVLVGRAGVTVSAGLRGGVVLQPGCP
jgi:hypothetical protein